MKKVTSIILALLLLLDSCGYFIVYMELSFYFKKEASVKINDFIPDSELEILAFHKTEISKINSQLQVIGENEINYKGILYDVYKEEFKNDSVYYYCLSDNNENSLEKVFTTYVENKTQDNTRNIPISNILNSIFKVAIIPVTFNNNYFQSSIKFVTRNVNLLPQYSNEIPTPPPKSFS